MNSEQLAWKIRRHVLEMTHTAKASHIGSCYSVADILAVLYNDILYFDHAKPDMSERDRVVLSKGHASAAMYAVLAEMGFFNSERLLEHCKNGGPFTAMTSKEVAGVEFSTGSLGHGLPVAVGMALAAKRDGKSHKVYVICGDGECDEGSNWEAALIASHFSLDNLVLIVDFNKIQCLDRIENVIKLERLDDKWKAFGWNVLRIDGHDHESIRNALKTVKENDGKPTAIIADTVKGKGVSFMEENTLWHYRFPHEGEEYDTALEELTIARPCGVSDPYYERAKI